MDIEQARAWCGGEPSIERFAALCSALPFRHLADDALELLLDELSRWPDSIPRSPPDSWIYEAAQKRPRNAFQLCTHVVVKRTEGTRALPHLMDSPHLVNVKHVELHGLLLGANLVHTLIEPPTLIRPKTLYMQNVSFDGEWMAALLATGFCDELETLSLDHSTNTNGAFVALAAHDLPHLRELSLAHNTQLDAHGALALAEAPWLSNLKRLDLSETCIGHKGMLTFEEFAARHPDLEIVLDGIEEGPRRQTTRPTPDAFGAMRSLLQQPPSEELFTAICARLGEGRPHEEMLEYVAGHVNTWPPHITRATPKRWVTSLLEGTPIEAFSLCNAASVRGALELLLASPHLPRLRTLEVEHIQRHPFMRGDFVHTLTTCDPLSELESLRLDETDLDDADMVELIRAPSLRRLRSLTLAQNDFGAEGLRTLARAPFLNTLTSLTLAEPYQRDRRDRPRFGVEALREFFDTSILSGLTHLTLELGGTEPEYEDLAAFLESPAFFGLEELELCWPLTTTMCTTLAQAPALDTLRVLELSVSEDGVEALARSTHLPSLEHLTLNVYYVSEEAFDRLLRSTTLPPGVQVTCGTRTGTTGKEV